VGQGGGARGANVICTHSAVDGDRWESFGIAGLHEGCPHQKVWLRQSSVAARSHGDFISIIHHVYLSAKIQETETSLWRVGSGSVSKQRAVVIMALNAL
jgi:hypothetical protein